MQRLRTRLRASASTGAPPSLSLDFLGLNQTLDSRITFSRGSNATLVDSTGNVTYAPNNLLTNSESFEAAAWSKLSGGTASDPVVTANAGISPDGTSTADRIVFDRGSGTTGSDVSYIQHSVTAFTGNAIASIWLKTEDNSTKTIGLRCGTPAAVQITVTGTWQRFSVLSTSASIDRFAVLNYGNYGNSSVTVLAWGAQLERVTYQTTPGTYNSTTPKNLLGYTQEFDNAAWSKTASTVTANSTAAPDGTMTADTINANAGAAGAPRVTQAPSTVGGQPYTISAYFKANGTNFAFLSLRTASVDWAGAEFNLVTGVVNRTPSNGTVTFNSASITPVGNGWYRCSVTVTPAAVAQFVIIGSSDGSGAFAGGYPSFTNAGTETVYIWGAQLSNSASLDPYVYNPGAAPTSTAYYGPRFDYDPVTLQAKGLLIEEQRTNLLVRSEEFDNASWTKIGTTVSANAATSPDGTADADSLVEDSATSDHRVNQPSISAGSGANTFSVYLKAGSRTFARIQFDGTISAVASSAGVDVNLSTGATGSTAVVGNISAASVAVTNVGNGWYRVALTATLSASGTLAARVFIMQSIGGSTSYTGNGSGNILLYGAQLEAGAFATSYIPTVASTVTRSADVATMQGANFSNWYNQSEGTIVFEGSVVGSPGASTVNFVQLSDGSSNSVAIYVGMFDLPAPIFQVSNGTTQANLDLGSMSANSIVNIAGAYKANDFAGVINGGTVETDTSGSVPTSIVRMGLGNRLGGVYMNGHIRRIGYYPTRLANYQLQGLTA